MRILVVGSGGREHALCWAIAASPLCDALFCAPGNGGIKQIAELVDIQATDISAIVVFAKTESIDFVVVGPEDPLCDGLVDALEEASVKAFGPSALAARLEGSKGFTKDLCKKYGIPTGAYKRCDNAADGIAYAKETGAPIVVKADGLAAGKGVLIAETVPDAVAAIESIFNGQFGDAGAEVVIEEFLRGEEASFFALCDGESILPLISAQDHKRVGDGDVGLNTGGMGAYSPAPIMTAEMELRVVEEIIRPTVGGMIDMGCPFKGVLFAGLMITDQGPELIEYNARFGDPECQVLMMRLRSDILPALLAAADGTLDHMDLKWRDDAALCVVMATRGYPEAYQKGSEIRNLEEAANVDGVEIFHAGTIKENGRILAAGGRVLNVTALGDSVSEAQSRAYQAVKIISWPEGFCRNDIGWRAVARESSNNK
jgi:phosphoribosylamine--glycine ligase